LVRIPQALSFRARVAVLLCVAVLASVRTPAASSSGSSDAGEIPDEKGRTPSEIAAEQRRDQAVARELESRKAEALEERRRAVSVPSDAGECLAYHRGDRRCLVTVGEFNRRLADDRQWVDAAGDSLLRTEQILDVRNRLLASLLEERYANALVDGQGEAGIQAEEAWRAQLAGIEASVGEDKLRALYRKHAAAFGPRREVQAEFLGASDSSFLDSLVRCMLDAPRAGALGKNESAGSALRKSEPAATGCASGRLYLWGKLEAGDLPEALPRITGKLRQGEISEIVRGRFGWFVVAAARVVEIPAKTYEESRPLLAYMVSLPETPAGTAADPARREDPVLRAWLLPRAASGKGRKISLANWSDTGLVSALRLRLSDLPAGVACEAAAHLRRSGRGISHTRFGTWYFQAEENLSAVRPGKGDPCDQEIAAPRSEPGPLSMAAEYLASKEMDFKRNLLEARTNASGGAGSGPRDEPSQRAKWIAENVTLANNVLRRF
jgi:hypothetical protein